MKQAIITIEIEVRVDVCDSVSLEGAEKIALFNAEAISGINTELNNKTQSIEVSDYTVLNTEWLDM